MSVQNGPVSDALALEAIRLIQKSLLRAVKNGEDSEARGDMLVASNLAGMAFNHAMVGVVHAIAHSIGAVAHVHHGLANGIMLPYGIEYNLEVASDRLSLIKDPHIFLEEIKTLLADLNQACGLPTRLSQANVKQEDLEKIAELAEQDGAAFYNPCPVEKESVLKLIERAF